MVNNINTIVSPVVNKFANKSVKEIGLITGLNSDLISAKISISKLSNEMFLFSNINLDELKSKFYLSIKTVRLKENGTPKESMSFEQIQFHNVINEVWENSFLKSKFTKTTFLFVVFQYVGEVLYFKGLKVWKMPEKIIDSELKHFWEALRYKLESGVKFKELTRRSKSVIENDLPSSKDSKIMHIRPKAKNAADTVELPDGQLITKQAYWFNISYIEEILNDLPHLILDDLNKTITINTNFNFNEIQPLLTNDLYTINQFIMIAQTVFSTFTNFELIEEKLNEIGYKLLPPFIIHIKYANLDEYFNKFILNDRYFELPNNDIWRTAFVQRKLENMENRYIIYKIDENIYLTETALKLANIENSTLISYRESVEYFVSKNNYFTLESLKRDGFHHQIENFGFEKLFLESLLKRPGRLRNLKLFGHLFFIKTMQKPNLSHFLCKLFEKTNQSYLKIDDFIELIYTHYNVILDFNILNNNLKSSTLEYDYFYSEELYILFKSKKEYLDFVH